MAADGVESFIAREGRKYMGLRMVSRGEYATNQVYNIKAKQTAGFRDDGQEKRKWAVKQM